MTATVCGVIVEIVVFVVRWFGVLLRGRIVCQYSWCVFAAALIVLFSAWLLLKAKEVVVDHVKMWESM